MSTRTVQAGKTRKAQGENVDTLSILVESIDLVLMLATALLGVIVLKIASIFLKLLPQRLRKFLTALATVAVFVAIFRALAAQQLFLSLLKSVWAMYILYTIKSFAIATLLAIVLPTVALFGCAKRLATKHEIVCSHNAPWQHQQDARLVESGFLRISPILLS